MDRKFYMKSNKDFIISTTGSCSSGLEYGFPNTYFWGVIYHHLLPFTLEFFMTVVHQNLTESVKLYYMCFTIKNDPPPVLLKLQEETEKKS